VDIPINNSYLVAGPIAAVIAIALFPIWIPILRKFGVMDHPNARKVHSVPIPRMGGVVIFVAFAIPVWLLSPPAADEWHGVLLGSAVALAIGCADDLWSVSAPIKLLSLFALTLLIWHFGIVTHLPLCPKGSLYCMGMNTVLNLLVTMLWLTGVCSAMNALDHMDGLAAGVSIIAAAAYLLVSIQTNQTEWALMSLALVGALTGFLLFNKPPARVFMGDSGSFFLGFALATIGIMGGWSSNPLKAAVVPISVLSMPIFDLCHVLLFRHLSGTTKTLREAIVYCGKDHIGHRLRTMGFSRSATLVMVCFIATTAAISALVIRQANYLESTLLLIQIAMIYITLTVLMEMARRRQNNEKKCD